MSNKLSVKILSQTEDPLVTLWRVWKLSRELDDLDDLDQVYDEKEAQDIFRQVAQMSIPVAEFIDFYVLIEDMPVAFREQLVRSRTNAYWLQSMRILDLHHFADEFRYRIPDDIEALSESDDKKKVEVFNEYLKHHKNAQKLYNQLTMEFGLPRQVAREHLGLNTLHRGCMKISMRALMEMMSRRSCWIAQSELWHPFVKGMASELKRVVGKDNAAHMVKLPCMMGNKRKGCQYGLENSRRRSGDDPLPVCPLWLCNDTEMEFPAAVEWWNSSTHFEMKDEGLPQKMLQDYESVWGRDPFTGKLKTAD